jgi:hypothetical protein
VSAGETPAHPTERGSFFADIYGLDLRSMPLAVGGGVLGLFIYGLVTKGRA